MSATATPERKTYTAKETARMLGIGRSVFYQLTAEGKLPEPLRPIRFGKRILFSKHAVDSLLGIAEERESA